MSGTIAQYTFISWYRKGLGNMIADFSTGGRAKSKATVFVNSDNQYRSIKFELTGPGDVEGINPQAVIKTEPRDKVYNFEANYLAAIEFYDEDFPWRYTPEPPINDQKLRPWLFLMVLKEDEFSFNSVNPNQLVQSIKVDPSDLNIPPDQAWAWAHVQVNRKMDVNGNLREDLEVLLQEDPDLAFSRLISPRKLEPATKYHAFLAPLYETGRRAGTGEPLGNISATQLAWDNNTQVSVNFPFYYHWEFGTEQAGLGDFETLAKRLEPSTAGELKAPTLNLQALIEELSSNEIVPDATKITPFMGAYKAPGQAIPKWGEDGNDHDFYLQHLLKTRINDGAQIPEIDEQQNNNPNGDEDPILNNPPLYGRWHSATNALGQNPQLFKEWLHDINLDPKYRAAAGLGAEVVRRNQELFMDDAWEPLGAVVEANQKLRQAQLAIEVNKKILRKHIESREKEEVLAHTERLHARMMFENGQENATLSKRVRESNLTKAGVNSGLRKTLRPYGKIARKLNKHLAVLDTGEKIKNARLVADLDDTSKARISGTPPRPKLYDFMDAGNELATSGDTSLNDDESGLIGTISTYINGATSEARPQIIHSEPGLKAKIVQKLHPLKTLGERVLRKIPIPSLPAYPGNSLSRIKPVMAAPELPYFMYEFLHELSSEFIFPGLSGIGNNQVLTMEPNQAFIEAFMLGLNHEMAAELLWREFPTDQRGTYFRKFWNTDDYFTPEAPPVTGNDLNPEELSVNLDDIKPIHQWQQVLGKNRPPEGKEPGLVLAIRGDLLMKFPNTIIYMRKAKFVGDELRELDDPVPDNIMLPLFKTQLDPDITIVGFELSTDQAVGTMEDAGWFFLFKEPLGEARFGLDDAESDSSTTSKPTDLVQFPLEGFGLDNTESDSSTMSSWNDLSWQHLNTPFVDLNIDIEKPESEQAVFGWEGDSAQMAYILYQAPYLLGIHASDFLPPSSGDSSPLPPNLLDYQILG